MDTAHFICDTNNWYTSPDLWGRKWLTNHQLSRVTYHCFNKQFPVAVYTVHFPLNEWGFLLDPDCVNNVITQRDRIVPTVDVHYDSTACEISIERFLILSSMRRIDRHRNCKIYLDGARFWYTDEPDLADFIAILLDLGATTDYRPDYVVEPDIKAVFVPLTPEQIQFLDSVEWY